MIADPFHALGLRAVGTAENMIIRLDTVANDPAATMLARRRHGLDRTFEAIEGSSSPFVNDLKGAVVVISAGFAFCHIAPPEMLNLLLNALFQTN